MRRGSAPGAAAAPGQDARPRGRSEQAELEPTPTRDRILDTALQLFTEKGFDATTLQEIADRLGFTKAAIYYHFRSKEDILMALHLRMHQLGVASLERMAEGPVTLEVWESLLSSLLDEMMAQRPLFLMHERNQAVLERIHRDNHEAQHEDLQARLREILSDPSISLRDRVRMSCSLGAVFGALFIGGEALGPKSEELAPLLRDAIHDLLAR